MHKPLRISFVAPLLVLALFLASSVPAFAVPVQPSNFYGTVLRGGTNVPDGTQVTAWVTGVATAVGSTPTFTFSGQSVYNLDVFVDDTDTPAKDGCVAGDTITFKVDSQTASQTGTCQVGGSVEVNLTVPSLAQATLDTVSPNSGALDTTFNVSLTGSSTHFVNGTTTASFGAGITVNSVTVTSATQATANITIAPAATTGTRTVTLTTADEVVTKANGFSVSGSSIDVYLPLSSTGPISAEVSVPVTISTNLTGLGILSYEFDLTYNSTVLEAIAIDKVGTLSSGWNVTENATTPGQWNVAAYGTSALAGSGVLLNLRFIVRGANSAETALTFTDFAFNSGSPDDTVHTGHFTVTGMVVAGNVTFAANGEPVPSTTMTLAGASNQNSQTAANGSYQLIATTVGNSTLTPSKQGDLGSAITAMDASQIARCVVGLSSISSCPTQSSDVSEDGNIMAYDAALIARYVVGITNPPSRTGQWIFSPTNRAYSPLSASIVGQNFLAYLAGDVTGNWPGTAQAQAQPSELATIALGRLDDTTQSDAISVPVHVEKMAGNDVLAFYLEVTYDPSQISFQDLVREGTISAEWNAEFNADEPGLVRIAGYGVQPLVGDGDLVQLHFQKLSPSSTAESVTLIDARFNEGQSSVEVPSLENQLYLPIQRR